MTVTFSKIKKIKELKMSRIRHGVRDFLLNEEGAALAESAILVAFIAIVCIVAVTFFGSKISTKFAGLGQSIS